MTLTAGEIRWRRDCGYFKGEKSHFPPWSIKKIFCFSLLGPRNVTSIQVEKEILCQPSVRKIKRSVSISVHNACKTI